MTNSRVPLLRTTIPPVAILILALASTALGDAVPGEVAVMLHPGEDIDALNARLGSWTIDAYPAANLYLIGVPAEQEDLDFLDLLESDPAVFESEPNIIQEHPEGVRAMVVSATGGTGSDFHDQAAAERIGLASVHAYSRGEGVVVAILDSGIDPSHPELTGRIHPAAYDFVNEDADPSEEANGLDGDGDGLIDEGFGHGTMVAGIVALVAPEATILPIRVLDDEGRGEAFNVAKGIRHAELHGARVVNLSLGGPDVIKIIEHQLEFAELAGMFLVAGGGNENRASPAYFPASDSHVLMVTAVDSADVKAPFADYSSDVAVAAPGVGIRTTYPGGGWALGDGCSFATPFVAAEVALILSANPAVTPEVVEDIVKAAVVPIAAIPGNEPFGSGLGSGRIYLPDAIDPASLGAWEPVRPASRVMVLPNPSRSVVALHAPPEWTPASSVRIHVFDDAGRLLRIMSGGAGEPISWDGLDDAGRPSAPGVYFIRLDDRWGRTARGKVVRIP